MRTLASVLDAAIQRSAAEITLESEQPVIYRTARGSEAEQAILQRTALFDMLAAAVSDELQVELMLGNAIEFPFEVQRIKWWVRAVPGADAMLVRVERADAAIVAPLPDPTDDLTIELADADSDRFAIGFGGLDAPPELDDPDFDLDAPTPPPRAAMRRPPSDPVPTAFESGTWALEEDDESEFELDAHAGTLAMPASDSTTSGRPPRFSSAPDLSANQAAPLTQVEARKSSSPGRPAAASLASRRTVNDVPTLGGDFIGLPADDDEGPARPARSGSGRLAVRLAQGRTHSEIAPLASPEAETRRELSAVGSPEADTHRELSAVGRGAPGIAADIGEGTLVYLLESGLAEQLVNALQAPSLVLDEHVDPVQLAIRVRALAPGSIIIVQREDPSLMLGWILRRLEEGFRVFLDMRARSLAGARRILLGVCATERAEAWLATHTQIVVESGESGPRVRPAERTS